MFQDYLNTIILGNSLSEMQMSRLMDDIFSGKLSDIHIGAVMAALAVRGETFEELAGAAGAMRRKALRIQTSTPMVLDTCGTGGDRSGTFNISTTAAFVVAGCGVTVAKHGNRSNTSKCGSADLLEALGVNLNAPPELVEEAVLEIGIGFLYAPLYHSAMRFAANARKQLGIRSIFNMLGPLTNPAAANCQLIGVYSSRLTEMFARALRLLGSRRAFVVHGHDGLDEISVCAPTRVTELHQNKIRTYDLMPETFFGEAADPRDLAGGTPDVNAYITRHIFNGEKGPRRNIVCINAAAALVAAGKVSDLNDGIRMAEASIDGGAASHTLNELIRFTRENG